MAFPVVIPPLSALISVIAFLGSFTKTFTQADGGASGLNMVGSCIRIRSLHSCRRREFSFLETRAQGVATIHFFQTLFFT